MLNACLEIAAKYHALKRAGYSETTLAASVVRDARPGESTLHDSGTRALLNLHKMCLQQYRRYVPQSIRNVEMEQCGSPAQPVLRSDDDAHRLRVGFNCGCAAMMLLELVTESVSVSVWNARIALRLHVSFLRNANFAYRSCTRSPELHTWYTEPLALLIASTRNWLSG